MPIVERPNMVVRAIQGSPLRSANCQDPLTRGAYQIPNPHTSHSNVWTVQSNVRASDKEREHEVVWMKGRDSVKPIEQTSVGKTGAGDGRGFVEELRPGDRVAFYVRAQASIHLSIAPICSVNLP